MICKKKPFLFIFIGLAFVLLAGCAISPQNFGISEDEWKGYDKVRRKEILNNYKQLAQEVKQQNEDAAKMSDTNSMVLEVKIFGGEAMLPPFTNWQTYMPATFTVMGNSCTNVLLSPEGYVKKTKIKKTTLRVCYKDKKLRLDPSRYDLGKKEGTITIPYSPIWDQGFTYQGINTHGHVRLRNATVVVKQN